MLTDTHDDVSASTASTSDTITLDTDTDTTPTTDMPGATGPAPVRPRLAAFHRDPPRQLNIRLEADDHDQLECYTRFYNESLGAEVAAADVAAQIIAQWMSKDRSFRRWKCAT